VSVVNPLVDPEVLAALARAGGPTGWRSRDDAMRRLFGPLLPDAVLTRATKAEFSTPVWGPAVRAFARDWAGEGVDQRLVDVARLQREWLAPKPDFRTALLLHAAWLGAR
jgi:asparagine synthase (glutamine-hydrolysing)